MSKPFNRFDVRVEIGDTRMGWTSKADYEPRELASHLRHLADTIDEMIDRRPVARKPAADRAGRAGKG